MYLKNTHLGLSWQSSGKESAYQCKGHGFDPWSGKTPDAAGQPGPQTPTTEAHAPWSPCANKEKLPQSEGWAPQLE